jgi:hypothetical protein
MRALSQQPSVSGWSHHGCQMCHRHLQTLETAVRGLLHTRVPRMLAVGCCNIRLYFYGPQSRQLTAPLEGWWTRHVCSVGAQPNGRSSEACCAFST